jgi:hypothetical protein
MHKTHYESTLMLADCIISQTTCCPTDNTDSTSFDGITTDRTTDSIGPTTIIGVSGDSTGTISTLNGSTNKKLRAKAEYAKGFLLYLRVMESSMKRNR